MTAGLGPRRWLRLSVAWIALFVLACSVIQRARPQPRMPAWQAESIPAWEEAFRKADPRWKGGDGASSVPLGGSRTLWLFGDTWITEPDAEGRNGAVLIRNSLAVQRIEHGEPGRIEFFWNEEDGKQGDAFPPGDDSGWLWPLSGVRAGTGLAVFCVRCVETPSPLGFDLTESLVVTVSNPDEPPSQWRLQRHGVPFFRHGDHGDSFFGVCCLLAGGSLYVYGVREDWSRGPQGRSVLLARAPPDAGAVADFTSWRFFDGRQWVSDWTRAAPLFDGGATEMSVSWLPALGRYVAVYTRWGLSDLVLIRTSLVPEGPWSAPAVLYRCPDVAWNPRYFSYAGKAHPELAGSDRELIVTYATNSTEEKDHLGDLRIYWPRFVRATVVANPQASAKDRSVCRSRRVPGGP